MLGVTWEVLEKMDDARITVLEVFENLLHFLFTLVFQPLYKKPGQMRTARLCLGTARIIFYSLVSHLLPLVFCKNLSYPARTARLSLVTARILF